QMLPAPFQDWTTPLLSDRYDSHLLPGGQKRGLLIGMGMTEKQYQFSYNNMYGRLSWSVSAQRVYTPDSSGHRRDDRVSLN
ncbi:hypothetical protein, partial [Escherichia coli]|uniref:hypothetical protein n=1 Tax=Escherichia coli TaxID=562 RepID=UPI001EF41155